METDLQVTVPTLDVVLSVLLFLAQDLLQSVVIYPDVTKQILLVTEGLITELAQ